MILDHNNSNESARTEQVRVSAGRPLFDSCSIQLSSVRKPGKQWQRNDIELPLFDTTAVDQEAAGAMTQQRHRVATAVDPEAAEALI